MSLPLQEIKEAKAYKSKASNRAKNMSRWIAVCCKHIIHRESTTIVQPSLSSQHMCPHTVVGARWKTQKPFTLLQSAPKANLAANPTLVQLAVANIQHIVRGNALGVHHLWRALAFELFCPLVVVEIENQFGRKALSSPCLISAEGGGLPSHRWNQLGRAIVGVFESSPLAAF